MNKIPISFLCGMIFASILPIQSARVVSYAYLYCLEAPSTENNRTGVAAKLPTEAVEWVGLVNGVTPASSAIGNPVSFFGDINSGRFELKNNLGTYFSYNKDLSATASARTPFKSVREHCQAMASICTAQLGMAYGLIGVRQAKTGPLLPVSLLENGQPLNCPFEGESPLKPLGDIRKENTSHFDGTYYYIQCKNGREGKFSLDSVEDTKLGAPGLRDVKKTWTLVDENDESEYGPGKYSYKLGIGFTLPWDTFFPNEINILDYYVGEKFCNKKI